MTYPSLLELTKVARKQLPACSPEFCMSIATVAQEAMEAAEEGSYPQPLAARDWGQPDVLRIAVDYLQFLQAA